MSDEDPERVGAVTDENPAQAPEAVAFLRITARVTLTTEDFISVWLALPQIRRLIFSLGYLVFGVTLVAWSGLGDEHHHYGIAAATVVLGSVSLIIGLRRGRVNWARNSLEMLRGDEGVEFTFDETRLTMIAPGREVHLDWTLVLMHLETPTAFVLYTGPQSLILVPKRAFAPDEPSQLRALFAQHIRPRPIREGLRWGRLLAMWLILLAAIWLVWHFVSS